MVGDGLATDLAAANGLGIPCILMLTGVTTRAQAEALPAAERRPAASGRADAAELAPRWRGSRGGPRQLADPAVAAQWRHQPAGVRRRRRLRPRDAEPCPPSSSPAPPASSGATSSRSCWGPATAWWPSSARRRPARSSCAASPPPWRAGVELRTGDVLEPATLPAALAGVDAVVHLVAIPRDWNGGKDLLRVNLGGTQNVLAAMQEAGVRRLVHLGALGVEDREELHYAKSKARAEAAVRASGLDWTILKPSLQFGPRDGFFNIVADLVRIPVPLVPVPGNGKSRFQPIHVGRRRPLRPPGPGAPRDDRRRPSSWAARAPGRTARSPRRWPGRSASGASSCPCRVPAHPPGGRHDGGAPPPLLPRRDRPAAPARARQRGPARRRPSRVRLRSAHNGGRAPLPAPSEEEAGADARRVRRAGRSRAAPHVRRRRLARRPRSSSPSARPGLVAALDHLPGGTGRPELTWTADRAVADDLDAASADLAALADAVGVLGGHGRTALADLVGRDAPGLAARARRRHGPARRAGRRHGRGWPAGWHRSRWRAPTGRSGTRRRRSPATTRPSAALAAVDPLRPAWERLTAGVVPATELTGRLLAHDRIAGDGDPVRRRREVCAGDRPHRQGVGRAGRGPGDPRSPGRDRRRRDARRVARAQRRPTTTPLRDLWDALRRSSGRVTDAVRDAAAARGAPRGSCSRPTRGPSW